MRERRTGVDATLEVGFAMNLRDHLALELVFFLQRVDEGDVILGELLLRHSWSSPFDAVELVVFFGVG